MRKVILLCILALMSVSALLTSCKVAAPVVASARKDSIVLRYEFLHDSIYIDRAHFEKVHGDTVWLHDTVTMKYFSIQNKVDTVYRDKEETVVPPPEKYIPPFYKWCTGLFLGALALLLIYIAVRIVIRIYLKR